MRKTLQQLIIILLLGHAVNAQKQTEFGDTVLDKSFQYIPFSKTVDKSKITVVTFVVYRDCYHCINEKIAISEEIKPLINNKEVDYKVVYLDQRDMRFMIWINDWAQKMKFEHQYYLDYYGKLTKKFEIEGVPTTIIIGTSGNIEFRQNGPKNNENWNNLLTKLNKLTSQKNNQNLVKTQEFYDFSINELESLSKLNSEMLEKAMIARGFTKDDISFVISKSELQKQRVYYQEGTSLTVIYPDISYLNNFRDEILKKGYVAKTSHSTQRYVKDNMSITFLKANDNFYGLMLFLKPF